MSMQITFLGHSTVLAQNGAASILTDPVFSKRVLIVKRQKPFPMKPEEVPEPSAILISHSHYDHLDLHTLKYFRSSVPIVLPKGLGKLVSKFMKNPIVEMTPNETVHIQDGLTVTAFPVSHTGFRLSGLTYRRCVGYLIDLNGKRIFFPGDTAYREDFQSFRDPDLALLPIGPCAPRWLMRRWHCDPEEALRILEETGARQMIPIHWGCFRFGPEPVDAPFEALKRLVHEKRLTDRVSLLQPGEKLEI